MILLDYSQIVIASVMKNSNEMSYSEKKKLQFI